jgi:hypothetical protein
MSPLMAICGPEILWPQENIRSSFCKIRRPAIAVTTLKPLLSNGRIGMGASAAPAALAIAKSIARVATLRIFTPNSSGLENVTHAALGRGLSRKTSSCRRSRRLYLCLIDESVHLLREKRIHFAGGIGSLDVPPNLPILECRQIHIRLVSAAAFKGKGLKRAK